MAHFDNWRFSRDSAWFCDMLDPEDLRNSETPERFPDYGAYPVVMKVKDFIIVR
jgi:hypothetical protein